MVKKKHTSISYTFVFFIIILICQITLLPADEIGTLSSNNVFSTEIILLQNINVIFIIYTTHTNEI